MTRKKVKLSWIVNDGARKASMKKRKAGLVKKVTELHTLCDVTTFIIIFGPEDIEPTIWPSREAILQIIARYQSLPEIERSKKNVNQEGYLKERLNKAQDQLKKGQFKCKQEETSYLMFQIDRRGKTADDFTNAELQGLIWLMDTKQKDFRERGYYLRQVSHPLEHGPMVPPIAANLRPPRRSAAMERTQYAGGGRAQMNELSLTGLDQWFIEMMNKSDHRAGGSSSGAGIIRREPMQMVAPNQPFVGEGFMGGNDFCFQGMNQFPDPFSCGGGSIGANLQQTGFVSERFGPPAPGNMNNSLYGNWAGFGGVNEMGLQQLGPDGVGGGLAGAGLGTGGEVMLPPFGGFGGGNDGSAGPARGGGEMGFPHNVNNTWPNN